MLSDLRKDFLIDYGEMRNFIVLKKAILTRKMDAIDLNVFYDVSGLYKIYGDAPYRATLVHGGPGARGEMASVARELSSGFGVIEYLQRARTIEGQIEELAAVIEKHGILSHILIGHSWGAWLCALYAARYPSTVQKLILVCSGPFEERYAVAVHNTRMERLDASLHSEVNNLMKKLNSSASSEREVALQKIGSIFQRTDTYDPIDKDNWSTDIDADIFQGVWSQALELRKSGDLLKELRKIPCSVVAIHGDYDPHPAEGVREPLERVLGDFRFALLEECGHKPWIEKRARDVFYTLIKSEIENE